MSKENCSPAFPLPLGSETIEGCAGMTLRDYFAAKAMQGEISNSEGFEKPESLAKFAYEVADAMLRAREAS